MEAQQCEVSVPFLVVGETVFISAACIEASGISGVKLADAVADPELTGIKKRFMGGLTFGPVNR